MIRILILATMVALAPLSLTRAADLNGVAMPDTRMADGTQVQLNGIGLRNFLRSSHSDLCGRFVFGTAK